MKPEQGDIVLFTFGGVVHDSELHANSAHGQTRTVPAIVVEVFGQPDTPALVNLQVFLDGGGGSGGGLLWETSVRHKSEAGPDESYWDWRSLISAIT